MKSIVGTGSSKSNSGNRCKTQPLLRGLHFFRAHAVALTDLSLRDVLPERQTTPLDLCAHWVPSDSQRPAVLCCAPSAVLAPLPVPRPHALCSPLPDVRETHPGHHPGHAAPGHGGVDGHHRSARREKAGRVSAVAVQRAGAALQQRRVRSNPGGVRSVARKSRAHTRCAGGRGSPGEHCVITKSGEMVPLATGGPRRDFGGNTVHAVLRDVAVCL